MTEKSVLFLTRSYAPNVGGVEKHVEKVAQELIKRGYKITIITESNSDKSLGQKKISKNLEIYYIPLFKKGSKKLHVWKYMWNHRDLVQKTDIIHAHDVFFWYMPLAVIYPLKKAYTTFHGYETDFPPRTGAKMMRRLSAFMSNKTISVGKFIEKWYGTKSEITIYGGVDAPVEFKRKNSGVLKILYIGRVSEDNGVYMYAESLKALDKNKVSYEFEVIGDGPAKDVFKKYGNLHGFVKDPTPFIQKADIIFASSYLSILESFSYKKPVFSIYQNALKKDYLLQTPFKKWIIATDDVMTLVHEIMKYARKNKTENTQQGYDWVMKNTWSQVADRYEELWK